MKGQKFKTYKNHAMVVGENSHLSFFQLQGVPGDPGNLGPIGPPGLKVSCYLLKSMIIK